jgi:hypothetical protein
MSKNRGNSQKKVVPILILQSRDYDDSEKFLTMRNDVEFFFIYQGFRENLVAP